MANDTVVFPVGRSINPARPDSADEAYDPRMLVLVLARRGEARPGRVITTFDYPQSWPLGGSVRLRHDQTHRLLGDYAVVGRSDIQTGMQDGDVPDRLLPWAVLK
jgi:hypothetical protein